jgi:hypothetical protein
VIAVVSRLRFVPARAGDRDQRLIGWASFALGDLLVDGVAVKLSAEGQPTINWPARYDRTGILRHSVQPLTDEARVEIERQLLEQLKPWLRGGAA